MLLNHPLTMNGLRYIEQRQKTLSVLFLAGPGLAGTRMPPFWILLELRVMEVVVAAGAINRRAMLQSNRHHQQTNTQLCTGLYVKSRVSVCRWWRIDWSFARLVAPLVTTTSIILSFNKRPANSGSPGKMAVKMERERTLYRLNALPVAEPTQSKGKRQDR